MPNPIIAKTFIPYADGTLICTATYSVQQTGTASDWGGTDPGSIMRLTRTSDLATLGEGPFQPCARTRMPQIYRATFQCYEADGEQTIALRGSGGAPGTAILYWDLDLILELIKR